jgi:hypothetical protein
VEHRYPGLDEKEVCQMIPEQIVDRLAGEIARRSGYNPNSTDPKEWGVNKSQFEETAKQYLRVALGHSPEFDLPNETTWNSETSEIKGVDEKWYEVPQPVLMRYIFTAGFAGANLSEYSDSQLSDSELAQFCEILYPFYKTLNEGSRSVIRQGIRQAMFEARDRNHDDDTREFEAVRE